MKTLKVLATVLFCVFLTQARAQGVLGADFTYAHQGGSTVLCSLVVYSDIEMDTFLIDYGSGYDTVVIDQSPIGNIYFGMGTYSYTYPGPGTYNFNIAIANWAPTISNITSPGTQPCRISGSLVVSPFFTANHSVQWGSLQNDVNNTGNVYVHLPQFYTTDNDSVNYSIVPVNATGYQLPSQTGGAESINVMGDITVIPPVSGVYAMAIRATDYREVSPGTFLQVGHAERVMVIDASTMGIYDFDTYVLSIYPNPATDYIQFPQNESYDVLVFDMQGKQVLQQQSVKDRLNVASLAAGTYSLYAVNNKNGNGSAVKFTKQ